MSFGCIPNIGIDDLGVKLRKAKYIVIPVLIDLCCTREKLNRTRKNTISLTGAEV
jgi:hypothetical protein